MRLLYYANGARYKASGGEWVFRKWVTVPSKELIHDMGVSRPTMYKIREELSNAGYIRFKAGIGNGTTEYMVCFQKETPNPKPTEAYRSLPRKKHLRKALSTPTTSLKPPCGEPLEMTFRGVLGECQKSYTPVCQKSYTLSVKNLTLPSTSFLFLIITEYYRESDPNKTKPFGTKKERK